MNAVSKLQKIQAKNESMICVGMDLDVRKMPGDHGRNLKGMFEFAQEIINATKDLVCAYKPNLAFYESLGPEGLSLLTQIIDRIPDDIPVIIDGKRNDIGNTATHYAEALYDRLNADWITFNPYMGYDTLRPFIERKDRGVFVLCLTSNPGSQDFQMLSVEGKPLYEVVAEKVAYWNKDNNCGLVVGATAPEQLRDIRRIAGDMPLLIPGVGAQGGSLEKAATFGTDNFTRPAVINVSRSVLYASRDADFAKKARQELAKLNGIIASIRKSTKRPELSQERAPEKPMQQPAAPVQAPLKPPETPAPPPPPRVDPRREDFQRGDSPREDFQREDSPREDVQREDLPREYVQRKDAPREDVRREDPPQG